MEYLTPLQNLLNQTSKHPNKVFLHQPINREWHEFTWADVEHQARCIAAGLKTQGLKDGANIGIFSKNCAHWAIVDLAIMMAGLISVPIYPTANRKTIDYIIKHADLKAVFVGKLDDIDEIKAALSGDILPITLPYPTISAQATYTAWLTTYSPLKEIHQPAINDLATIVYTSGSTGVPKGVVITHKNWASAAQATAAIFNMSSNDRGISYLPLAHIVERSLAAVSLYVGIQVFFAESIDTFIEDLQYAKPTVFGSVPRLWTIFQSKILMTISQKKLSLLLRIPLVRRIVINKIKSSLGLQCATRFASGTAPTPLSLLKWYEEIGITISDSWGMTETSSLSCANMPYMKNNLGTIGLPLECLEMKLSVEGEILVRGDAVFSEYYLDPEATEEAFVDGWFRTGDCAEINNNGAYKIIGRIKDKFKTSKGKYVSPVPIESLLSANTDIEQVCVMGIGLKQPVAVAVLTDTFDRNDKKRVSRLEQTIVTVNNSLESHQKLDYLFICKEVWSIQNGLLTPTMKMKRHLIEEKYLDIIGKELHGDIIWEENLSAYVK